MKILRSIFALFSIVLVGKTARALDFTEFGAISFSKPSVQSNQDPGIQSNLGYSWGGGISLGMRILDQLDIESGILYIGQSYSTTSTSNSRAGYTLWTSQVPLLLRYWISDKFSMGGGLYYSHGSGNVDVNQNSNTNYLGYSDLSWSTDDMGLCISLRYRSPLSDIISYVIDARTLIGTTNVDRSGQGSLQTLTLQVWGGFSFIL